MIEKVSPDNFSDVLPLIREYQEFYAVENIDETKNEKYFSQFLTDHQNGVLYLCHIDGKAIGFATIYKGFSSTRAETVAVLNDLYVQTSYRGNGYGKDLINYAESEAKKMGFSRLQWLTAQSNERAQQLYNDLDVSKSIWFFYAKEI
ncbi:MAG: GNAT family N-acetyltransferase [Gammaproteobacteria bacterium]|nr:GNAT family N-acetyltransferase [Gammaproteobacteria bacterium]